MSDPLLPYYNRELAFIRRMGAEFAAQNPKIAGRLRLTADSSEDPNVARIIEGFAYLNARIRHKLDDDFPEITDALLGVLYPHYVAPVPSMAIAQIVFDKAQAELTAGYHLPRDVTIETDPIEGDPCRFRTCYPVKLWPITVASASIKSSPFSAPQTRWSADAGAVIRLEIKSLSKEVTFKNLPLESLRFFLKGQSQHTYPLYELLFNNVMGVALANSPLDKNPLQLDKRVIQPVGFDRDQGMLPYPARSFIGYRLLTEFFAFPEKFLFFDLAGLDRKNLSNLGSTMDVYLFLNRAMPDLDQNVTADTFRMGCTPIVNLFQQRAEPIQLTQTETEYRVVPDARRPLATEIYSVDRVTATSPDGETLEYQPFYSFKHGVDQRAQRTFWTPSRRPARSRDGKPDYGTEVYLSLVDLDFNPSKAPDWILDVETTCLSRDLPRRLPFGGDQPRLHLSQGGPVEKVLCLTPPGATFRPVLRRGALWRLISHLSLGHLSMVEEGGADALKEMLKLYDFADAEGTRATIDGIMAVKSRRVVGPAGGRTGGVFCRGVEVTVDFDETKYVGSGLFLFAAVLERFFGLYCSVNSFSKMIARTKQREGELHRWAPRAGEKVLL